MTPDFSNEPEPVRPKLIPRRLLAAAFLLGFGSLATIFLVSSRRAQDTVSERSATDPSTRVHQNRLAEALAQARERARQEGMTAADLAALPAEPRTARREIAAWRLIRFQDQDTKASVSPYALAALYAELGDADHTFAELDRAFAESDPSLVSADIDPAFDAVRADPRFAQIVARIGPRRR